MGAITATILAGAQAYGTIMEGQAAKSAYEYNAAVSRAEAQAVGQAAVYETGRIKKAAKSIRSSQQARYAASGVKLEGSPLEVMLDSASEAELDILLTEHEAGMKQTQLEAEANMYKRAGKLALRNAYMKAGTTFLSSAASSGLGQQKPQYANIKGQGRVLRAPDNYYKRNSTGY